MARHEQTSATSRPAKATSPTADIERWAIDPARSRLTFVLRHLVVSEIRGEFHRWGGTLYLDRRQPLRSSVEVWVDAATIDTDERARDAHVRSSELLDIERFPRVEFESWSIEERRRLAVVHGRLHLHGVTHDVAVEVEPYVMPGPGDNRYRARGEIDRQRFGLRWNQDLDIGGVVLGDDIEVIAELALVRANGAESPA